MSDSTHLERRYRRLLALYPKAFRPGGMLLLPAAGLHFFLAYRLGRTVES